MAAQTLHLPENRRLDLQSLCCDSVVPTANTVTGAWQLVTDTRLSVSVLASGQRLSQVLPRGAAHTQHGREGGSGELGGTVLVRELL